MARTKIKDEIKLKSWLDVDAALREIGEKQIALDEIEGDMNKRINEVKEAFKLEAKPYQERIEQLGKDIKEYVTEFRDELNGKTKVLNFGKTGFRLSTVLSLPSAKDKVAKIIEKLRNRGMEDCINVTEKIDKEALKKYDETTIIELGGTLKKTDTFWYEPDRTALVKTE